MIQPDDIEVLQTGADDRVIEKLSDGSMAVYDSRSKTVHSLNPAAAVAWEACRDRATPARIRQAMERAFGQPVAEETALAAVSQLESAGLVATSKAAGQPPAGSSRRSMMKAVGAIGISSAFVLTLSAAQQRKHTKACLSNKPVC